MTLYLITSALASIAAVYLGKSWKGFKQARSMTGPEMEG